MSDYNGWSGGYATWATALWIDNEQATYDYARELASMALEDEHPRVALADALRGWIRPRLEPDEASLAADLLGYALDGVDWHEIAEHYLEDVSADYVRERDA